MILPMSDAPRDGTWIILHLKDGRERRAAWMTPVWSVTRDPNIPDWMDTELKFADPFSESIGWTP